MKGSRSLLLAGGTVVSVAAVRLTRRRTRQPPPQPQPSTSSRGAGLRWWHIPVVYGATRMALDMPDLPSIFLGAWNLGNLIWNQIADILLSVLQQAFRLLVNILEDALHLVDQTFERVFGAFDWIYEQIAPLTRAMGDLIQKTWDGVELAFKNFREQLQGWLENGYNLITDYVLDRIPDVLRALLGGAWDFLEALMGIGMGGLRFLIDLIDDPVGVIWDLIKDLVEDAVDFALPPLEWIVEQGLNIIFAGYGDVIDLLKRVWHILEWMAEHLDELDPTKLDDVFSIGLGSFFDRVADAFDSNSGDLEKKIASWLG